MRQRTVWDWRLKLYPLIVIPAMVYLNAAPQGHSAAEGPRQGDTFAPAVAAPYNVGQKDGSWLVCERHSLVTFCMRLTTERR